jgi:hypothetical protein
VTLENIKQFNNGYTMSRNDAQLLKIINNTKRDFDLIFSKIEEIDNRIKAINQNTSYLFNYLSLFDINENKMSEILSYLLNPKAKHGQGDIYLREFCSGIDTIKEFSNVIVETEHCTDTYRRIDILIRINDHWLIIENKYREAGDQENQLSDYYMYAKRKLGEANADKIYMFYLTSDRNEPLEFTLRKEFKMELGSRLRCMSFKEDICNYLKRCKDLSKTPKINIFIEDLNNHIKGSEYMEKDKKEEIFKWLSEDERRVKSTREIRDLYDDAMKYLKSRFIEKFQSELNIQVKRNLGEEWLVTQDKVDIFEIINQGFNVSKQEWKNEYIIGLASYSKGFNNIYYGLCSWHKNTNLKKKEKILQASITEKFGKSQAEDDDQYIWWNYVSLGRYLDNSIDDICRLTEQNRNVVIERWVNQLIALAKFVKPHVDKLITSNNKELEE